MTDKIKFYQINLNKCEGAQANLMVELAKLKAQFVCLIQEPHFYRVKPSSIDKSCMQVLHGNGTKQNWPRAMIVASKGLNLSQIEALTSRDTTCINLHTPSEELILVSSYQDITFPEVINNIENVLNTQRVLTKTSLLALIQMLIPNYG